MASYTVRGIPQKQYDKLIDQGADEKKARTGNDSINKQILKAISSYLGCTRDHDTCKFVPPGSCGPDCHGFTLS